MMETRESEVGGYTVRCTQHRARAAARLLAKVGRCVAPALAKIKGTISADEKAADLKEMDLADIGPAIAGLFESLEDDRLDALMLEIFAHTTITMPSGDTQGELRVFDLSRGEQIDSAFTGNLPLMFGCIKFALEVNFGSFFGAKGVIAAVAAMGAKARPST